MYWSCIKILNIARLQLDRSDLTRLITLQWSWLLLRVLQNCCTVWRLVTTCSWRAVVDTKCSEAANSILIIYWKIYGWLSFIALKSRYSRSKIQTIETQDMCECQDANFNWSIHTTEFWLQHLRRLYFQQYRHFSTKSIRKISIDCSTNEIISSKSWFSSKTWSFFWDIEINCLKKNNNRKFERLWKNNIVFEK